MTGGSRGKKFNDLLLAGRVRNLALDLVEKALLGNDEEFKKQLLLKLATTILPRLNEHSGPDGADLPTPILKIDAILRNDSNQENSEVKQED